MLASSLNLPATDPSLPSQPQFPGPNPAGDDSAAPFADVMNAALSRPGAGAGDPPDNSTQSPVKPATAKKDNGKQDKSTADDSASTTKTTSSGATTAASTTDAGQTANNSSAPTDNALALAVALAIQPPVIQSVPMLVKTAGSGAVATILAAGVAGKSPIASGAQDAAVTNAANASANGNTGGAALPSLLVANAANPAAAAKNIDLSSMTKPQAVKDSSKEQPVQAASVKDANQTALPSTPAPVAAVNPQTSGQSGDQPGESSAKYAPEIAGLKNVETTSSGSSDVNGMSGAQYNLQMKKTAETLKSTDLTEQNLPVNPATIAGAGLPVAEKRTFTAPTAATGRAELSALTDTTSAAANETVTTTGALTTASRSTEPSAMVERAGQMIIQNAVQLSNVGADSLQVVIKPGGDLQLSLQLQQHEGAVEVQATLQNGNFDLMSRHWPQLQEQLEARGIRLAPLVSSEQLNLGQGGNNQFQQPNSAQRDQDLASLAGPGLPAFNPGMIAPATKTTVPAAPSRGWESWA